VAQWLSDKLYLEDKGTHIVRCLKHAQKGLQIRMLTPGGEESDRDYTLLWCKVDGDKVATLRSNVPWLYWAGY